jgi:hypothetical protein
MIASAVVNAMGGKSKPADFMPRFDREAGPAAEFIDPATVDTDLIQRKIVRANAALGGR